ncbi:hypothetical protein ACN9KL_09165 [Vagococcus fluvialis]|uniref:hypothetical protein n=1 Tax=Vagococcus fluvialis TaxID=2738 RepID=UPI003B2272F6
MKSLFDELELRRNIFKVILLYFIFFFSFLVTLNPFMLLFIFLSSSFIFFTNSTSTSLAIYFAILPVNNIVSLNYDFQKSYFFLITIALIIRLLIFQRINTTLTIIYLLFVSYIYLVATYFSGLSFSNLLALLNYSLIIFLVSKYNKADIQKIILLGSIGFLLSSWIGVMRYIVENLNAALRSSSVLIGGTDTLRFSGLAYDTNYYGVWSIFLVSCLLVLFSKESNRYIKNMYLLLLISIASLGFLTYSKAFVLTLLLLIIFYIVIELKMNPFKIIGVFMFIFIVAILLKASLDFSIIEFISSRIIGKSNNLTSFTTHRDLLWKEYLNHIFSSFNTFLFGSGIRNQILHTQVAHNFYIEILYLIGFIGTIGFLSLFSVFYLKLKKRISKKISLFQLSPLLSFLVVAFSLNFFSVNETVMYLFIAIIFSTINLKEEL